MNYHFFMILHLIFSIFNRNIFQILHLYNHSNINFPFHFYVIYTFLCFIINIPKNLNRNSLFIPIPQHIFISFHLNFQNMNQTIMNLFNHIYLINHPILFYCNSYLLLYLHFPIFLVITIHHKTLQRFLLFMHHILINLQVIYYRFQAYLVQNQDQTFYLINH